jgi:hypothetical protein
MIRRVAVLGGLLYAANWVYDTFLDAKQAEVSLPTREEPA